MIPYAQDGFPSGRHDQIGDREINMKHSGSMFALGAITTLAAAPVAEAQQDQTWAGAFVSGAPSKESPLLVWFDGHARFRDGAEELDVSILRPGVGWRVNGQLDVYVGYASVTQHRDTGDIEEDRIWQQLVYPIADIAGGKLTGRTRLEQRFRDTGGDTGWRLRQFLRYGRPIDGTSFGIVASTEVFVGLNEADWGQADGFDQNRLFLGASWQITPQLRLEGGYLNQHINGPTDTTRDNLAFNLFAVL
jgi:Protein of unknown function (DUF2490)